MENKDMTFEECLKQLEEIVAKLESKDISLDDAVKYYQKGLELSKRCYEIFNQTQEVIVKKVEGSIITDFNQE
jgi:exodeoxyribonuclease VII small subunit